MASYSSSYEDAVLQTVVPRLEAEGFWVFLHPTKNMLPPFLDSIQPDAIAYKGEKKLALEVVAQPPDDGSKARRIRDLFAEHPEWELRLIYAPRGEGKEALPVLPKATIEDHLDRIESSLNDPDASAALLIAWAAFEAAARRVVQGDLSRPQSVANLLEKMAFEGYVTPDEAESLRRIGRLRNDIAHGRLDLAARIEDVQALVGITRTILNLDEA